MDLPERILFVGAHCDDIELFAGGLLARVCRTGRRAGVLAFSDHRGIVDDERAAQAGAEFGENVAALAARPGARIINHSKVLLPACQGVFESERAVIYAALETLRGQYDLVVTHRPSDTNQDHRQVALEAARVFKAHASLLGGEFPGNDIGGATPACYVPLTREDVDRKVEMVLRYRSQQFNDRPYFDEDVIRALARVRGSQIRREAAEAYSIGARLIFSDG